MAYKDINMQLADDGGGAVKTMEWRSDMGKGGGDTMDLRPFDNLEREPVFIIGSNGNITPSEQIKLPDSANGRINPENKLPFPEKPGPVFARENLYILPYTRHEFPESSKLTLEQIEEFMKKFNPDSPSEPIGSLSPEQIEEAIKKSRDPNASPYYLPVSINDLNEPFPGIGDGEKPGLQLPSEVLEALNKAAEEAGMEEPYSITVTRENCPELFDKIQEMIDEQQGGGLNYPGGSKYFNEATGRYEYPDDGVSYLGGSKGFYEDTGRYEYRQSDDGPKGFLEHEAELNENPVLADGQPKSIGTGAAGGVARDAMEKLAEQAKSVADQAKDVLGIDTPILGDPEELARRQEQQKAFFESFNKQLEDIDLDAAFENMKHPDVGVTLMGAVADDPEAGVESGIGGGYEARAAEAEQLANFENDGLESGSDDYGPYV